jgi:hypothetical protein
MKVSFDEALGLAVSHQPRFCKRRACLLVPYITLASLLSKTAGLAPLELLADRRTSISRSLLHSEAALILLPQKSITTHASGIWLLSTAAIP